MSLTESIFLTGFAILYIFLTVPYVLPWRTQGSLAEFLSWCHLIGAVSPWIGSFLYHVFMNVNYGEDIYRKLLKIDMLGIWLCQSFGNITQGLSTSFNNFYFIFSERLFPFPKMLKEMKNIIIML